MGAGGAAAAAVTSLRVRWVMPRASPRRPPGSSAWRLHQEPVPALVVGGDVDVFSARLLGGEAPSVDVMGTFLLLLRIRPFLLQLLPFVFRPPVLEPHFHLGEEEQRKKNPFSSKSDPPKKKSHTRSAPWSPCPSSLSHSDGRTWGLEGADHPGTHRSGAHHPVTNTLVPCHSGSHHPGTRYPGAHHTVAHHIGTLVTISPVPITVVSITLAPITLVPIALVPITPVPNTQAPKNKRIN